MTAAAFKACYSDWKLIKTRGVVQVVMEIPLAEADAAYNVLGGMPDPGSENWFAVAALNPLAGKEIQVTPAPQKLLPESPSAGGRRNWSDLQPAAQAGIRCGEPSFRAFLNESRAYAVSDATEAAEAVREICNVGSRVELGTNQKARVIWHQLDAEFQAWILVSA